FDHKGSKDGETLTASLNMFAVPGEHSRTSVLSSDGSSLTIRQDNRWLSGGGKVDWQHPIGKDELLSLGGTWDYVSERQDYAFASTGTDGSLGPNSVDRFTAATNTLAPYT